MDDASIKRNIEREIWKERNRKKNLKSGRGDIKGETWRKKSGRRDKGFSEKEKSWRREQKEKSGRRESEEKSGRKERETKMNKPEEKGTEGELWKKRHRKKQSLEKKTEKIPR